MREGLRAVWKVLSVAALKCAFSIKVLKVKITGETANISHWLPVFCETKTETKRNENTGNAGFKIYILLNELLVEVVSQNTDL